MVPAAEGAAWAVGTRFLEQGSTAPAEGVLWAGVSSMATGAVGGALWLFVSFFPCPSVPPVPQYLPGFKVAGTAHLPNALSTSLAREVLKDPG